MKSRIIVIFILCLILIGCCYGVYSIMYGNNGNDNDAVVLDEYETTTIRSQVYSDYLENVITMDGCVINKNEGEYYTVSSDIRWKEEPQINCEIGMEVSAGDVVYTIGKKEYKSEVSGIVMDIAKDKEYLSIVILDYDNLCIDAKVNYVYRDKLFIGKEINVSETNPLSSKECRVEDVKSIGCFVESDMIDVILTNATHYLPGTTLKCEFKYKEEVKACYALKKMVLEDANGKFVYVENNGKREKRQIEVGKEFSVASDGVTSEYIEILSGVSEGEGLIVDVAQ